jgi:hypothetical protein
MHVSVCLILLHASHPSDVSCSYSNAHHLFLCFLSPAGATLSTECTHLAKTSTPQHLPQAQPVVGRKIRAWNSGVSMAGHGLPGGWVGVCDVVRRARQGGLKGSHHTPDVRMHPEPARTWPMHMHRVMQGSNRMQRRWAHGWQKQGM